MAVISCVLPQRAHTTNVAMLLRYVTVGITDSFWLSGRHVPRGRAGFAILLRPVQSRSCPRVMLTPAPRDVSRLYSGSIAARRRAQPRCRLYELRPGQLKRAVRGTVSPALLAVRLCPRISDPAPRCVSRRYRQTVRRCFGRAEIRVRFPVAARIDQGSSNGRTRDFGSRHEGSIPSP